MLTMFYRPESLILGLFIGLVENVLRPRVARSFYAKSVPYLFGLLSRRSHFICSADLTLGLLDFLKSERSAILVNTPV